MNKSGRMKILTGILTMLFLAVLLPPRASSAAVVTMKYNPENNCWTASFIASSGSLFLKLTAPFSGLLYVDGSELNGTDWEESHITMVKKNGKRIDRYEHNRINDLEGYRAAYGVTTGTYYLKLKAVVGRKYWIRAYFVQICADYGGGTKGSAYSLKARKTTTGVISVSKSHQYRWFKFRLKRSAPAKVKVTVNGGQGRIMIYVKGPGTGGTVKKKLFVGAYGPETCSVKVHRKGWYYVLVTKDANTADRRSSGQFTINWRYL